MIEGIVEAVLSSILIAVLFELWSKRKALSFWKREKDDQPSPPVIQAADPVKHLESKADSVEQDVLIRTPPSSGWNVSEIAKTLIRLGIAATVGFIFGGCSAGILEAEGYSEITLGSGASLLAIMLPTLLMWAILYRFGPLKGKQER